MKRLIALIALVSCGRALAQSTTEPVAHQTPAPDSVDEELIDAERRPAGLFKYGVVSMLDPVVKGFNEKLDTVGLKVGFAYTLLYQAATTGNEYHDAGGGDFDAFGNWRLIGPKDDPYNGYLYFAAEYRHDLGTGIPPSELGGQFGSLWGTTNGFGEQRVALKELYWQQHVARDRLIIRVGKLDPENYYNSNYWQSDNKYFLNKAFSSFPVRAFPGQGLGMNVTTKLSDAWYISTGFQDAQGKKTSSGFDTFFNDFNLFTAFELGWTPAFQRLGSGTYRLTPWYRDAGESNGLPHDSGIVLSIDQHISEHLIPFFRYGVGEGNINNIEQMISTGIGWEGKLLTESDAVAIGGSWGKPANHDLRDQFAAEIFYRLQLSPDNQFTVGTQLIINPSNDPDHDAVGVFEARWRVAM